MIDWILGVIGALLGITASGLAWACTQTTIFLPNGTVMVCYQCGVNIHCF